MSSELENFFGVWTLDKTENFDEYMKAIGVGYIMRKIGNSVTPVQHISIENDEITIKTVTTFKSTEIKFILDNEFDEITADDTKVKSVMRFEKGTLVHEQKDADGKLRSIIKRCIESDSLVMVLEATNSHGEKVISTRKYKKTQ